MSTACQKLQHIQTIIRLLRIITLTKFNEYSETALNLDVVSRSVCWDDFTEQTLRRNCRFMPKITAWILNAALDLTECFESTLESQGMCFATKSQERKEEIMKNVKPVFRSSSLFNVLTFYKQCHNAKKKRSLKQALLSRFWGEMSRRCRIYI